jgi:hypothetical protein
MRWIFFTLVMLNVALFAYVWQVHHNALDVLVSTQVVDEKVATLTLLDEIAERKPVETIRLKKQRDQIIVAQEEGEGQSQPISRSLCTLVGSFAKQDKADVFVARLLSMGVKAKVKNLLVSTTVGYWLHLPPLASRKELLRRLSELRRQGVDSYIIPDGDLANGISLGMFSEKQRAKGLQDNIAHLGYQPKIIEVPREKREVWVFLMQGESAKISEESWSELLSGKDLLQKQQNLCSDVASA